MAITTVACRKNCCHHRIELWHRAWASRGKWHRAGADVVLNSFTDSRLKTTQSPRAIAREFGVDRALHQGRYVRRGRNAGP